MNIEQALRLTAGIVVGVSVLLAVTVSVHWLWLTGFVALNLIQSAFTDTCPAKWLYRRLGVRPCDAPPRGTLPLLLLLAAGVGLFPLLAEAQAPDARDLALRAYEAAYFPGEDVQWETRLEITDRRDRVRIRELEVLRKNTGAHEQKYYVYFHEPAAVRRTVFLVWTRGVEDDDRWLYLPATDLTQRITGRQKRNSFAGSDFTYEDVTGRHPDQDELVLLGEEELDGRRVWTIRGEPRDPGLVEFGHYRIFIDRETHLPLKGEFYTPAGELHRILTIDEWEEIDGHVTPTRQRAVDHQSGSVSVATMSRIRYDQGLPEHIFEQRFLQRPPTPYIQPRR